MPNAERRSPAFSSAAPWLHSLYSLPKEETVRLKRMSNKPLVGPVLTDAVFPLGARIFISAIFVQGALGKILGWSGQASYMQSHNLPAQLIPAMLGVALLIEAAGVLCLLLGWQARAAAFVMCL